MERTDILKTIIQLFIECKYIKCSNGYIIRFFNKILNKINKNANMKLLLTGCNIQENTKIFDNKYNIFVYNFITNMDPHSKINENLDNNKYYLISNLHKYILFSLLFPKIKNNTFSKKIHNKLFDKFNIKKIVGGNSFYLNPNLNIKYVETIELKSK